MVTRVVPVLLMFRGLSGRYDPADALTAERHDREEQPPSSLPDDLDSLLIIWESRIDFLKAIRIFQGLDRIHKIYAVLKNVISCFALVPFILHAIRRIGRRY